VNELPPIRAGITDEFGVDYTLPVFGQIAGLGDRYWEWAHRHLSPKFRQQLAAARAGERWPDSFPIFARTWLEAQTHIRWQAVLALWGTTLVALAVAGARATAARGWVASGWWVAGFLLWTLVEYGLHRGIFHHEPRSLGGRQFHFLVHGIHHKDPWDQTRLVFPILGAIAIAAALFAALRALLAPGPAMLAMSGLLGGYLAYDLGHYAWHHAPCRGGLLLFLKRYHLAHHFKDMDRRFGVSQPLWDWVFRSGGLRS